MENKMTKRILFLLISVQVCIQHVNTVILTPPYFNLVTNKPAHATSTCGEDVNEPELYCKLTGASAADRETLGNTKIIQGQYCDYCDPSDPDKTHSATNAIDGTDRWWQSPPLSRSLDYNMVNFTIDLRQEFHVAFIYIKMGNSPRPGIWALERSTDYGKTYAPWQYFADTPSDCFNTFNTDASKRIENDDDILCTTEYSKVLPVEGGEILVSLVNNRPSSKNFSNSDVLQQWTRATNVRLRLIRTKNLLGHLMAVREKDNSVTRRYFYSIRDISIGGRCVCNGHAQDCEASDPDDQDKLVCNCQHNTCGDQCQECCPGFVQKKWRQNRENNEYQCEPCQCHGHSDSCHYDADVDAKSQSLDIHGMYAGGGVCDDCQHNTMGINCDKCKDGFYLPTGVSINETDACRRCPCYDAYSTGSCEQGTGKCECKKQYVGDQCENCADGFYDWPTCRPCECHVDGRADNLCVSTTGNCNCKFGYETPYCNQCIDGFYGFPDCKPCDCNEDGKLNSFCNKDSGQCMCRPGYVGVKCEKCDNGYFGLDTCVSCDCDGGAADEVCEKDSGKCVCKPNYTGERCNECAQGFYNFPDCLPCACDLDGSIGENCTYFNAKQCYCKEGRGGASCDQCAPGYYQYPECIQCSCDEYGAIGQSCDPKTGKCKCKANFVGDKCSECGPNLYNYPICEECRCHPDGVQSDFPGCSKESTSVICPCKEHVTGRQCDQCKDLFWGLGTNDTHGCSPCECSKDGALNELDVCDKNTGQCLCKPLSGSLTCDECTAGSYGLQHDQLFGCEPCECKLGSSVDNVCDKTSGQCACLPNVIGDKCEEPAGDYYTPSLHQLKFEIEDGYTPNMKAVRYGFNKTQFPNYSWKGYVNFNKLQNEVLQDIKLDKLGSYRMVLNYVNTNTDLSEVFIRILPKDEHGDEQNTTMYLPSASKPEFATVVRNQINAVTFELENDKDYTISFKTASDAVFLDYFVLLPSEYYEPNMLKKNIEKLCHDYNDDLCVHYVYPPLEGFKATVLANDPIYEDISKDFNDIKANHTYKSPVFLVPVDSDKSLTVDVEFPIPAQYVLLVEYINQHTSGIPAKVNIKHADSRQQNGNTFMYKCDIASLCREAILSNGVNEPLIVDGNERATLRFDTTSDGEALIYRVIAVPKEKFDLNMIKMAPKCILRNGECTPIEYTRFPQLVKMELENNQPEERQDLNTNIKNKKQLELANPKTKLVYMHDFYPEISVPIQTSRRDKGDHVMIVHFYQPNHPLVNVSVSVDNSFKGSFHATNCPSISGCRSIVRFETGETFDYADSRTINFQLAQNGKDIWLDYVLFAPAANVNPDLLKGAPIDFTDEFLNKCASQHFNIDPEVSKFCDESVFALSTRYNNGAETCGCDPNGSLSTQCDKLGGQCQCKENVIGRQCSRCKTGFYGFPNCKECNCPSGNCDDQTGSCICAQNVEEGTCSRCVPGTYGFDPYFGCDDCDCNLDGTIDGNGVCNPDSGQCDCKTNLDGRRCDVCKAGFYNYPQCLECSCNANGTIDRICDPNYANCLCKDNVNGPNCDQCEYGTFNLESRNPKGCTKCFCFGLTDHCISSHYYFRIMSHMNASDWKLTNYKSSQATLVENDNGLMLNVNAVDIERPNEAIYWIAPAEYLGKKIYSYGGALRYSLLYTAVDESTEVNPQRFVRPDLILTGNNMTIAYTSLNQPAPNKQFDNSVDLIESQFSFLHTGFTVSRDQLLLVLDSLTELKIRASYIQHIKSAELRKVELDQGADQYEHDDVDESRPALSVERCNCPPLHRGLSCESCAPGYYKQKGSGIGSFTCVPCNCNGKSDVCDEDTGECLNCEDNTTGKNCETCKPHHYAIQNGENGLECRLCPCPGPMETNVFATGCMFDANANKVYYCSCLPGYTGQFCERCAPGYYGDPVSPNGKCLPCQCNQNIDLKDYGSCDQRTGACVKCLNNTAGLNCEKTAPWHYGDPIVLKNVRPCKCDKCGTNACDAETGECKCKPNVKGFTCNSCAENTWGFNLCDGCKDCNCDPIGSIGSQCNSQNGYCSCKPGVGGKFCDQCLPDYWNFTSDGCQPCHCDKYGVQSGLSGISCNAKTGDCKCIPGVKGKYCDKCDDRWILVKNQGCKSCDTCVHTLLDDLESLFIKADGIENRNSSLMFKANNKLVRLEDEYNALKSSITPDSASNTAVATLARTINNIKNYHLPDVYFVTSFQISEKINSFTEVHQNAVKFTDDLSELRIKLDSLNRAIEELDRRDIYEQKNLTGADLGYYERLVSDIVSKDFNQTFKDFDNALSKFRESNVTAQKISDIYNSHLRQMEMIKNKTAYLQNSLNEIKGYVDRAKNLEKFRDRDVTFKAYVDSLGEIKAETNAMKEESQRIINNIQDILKSSELSLNNSISELNNLDGIVANMNGLFGNHDENFRMLREKYLQAEAKTSSLARTAKQWKDKLMQSASGQQAYEMAKVHDKVADMLMEANRNSKDVLEKYQKVNQTLAEFLNSVSSLNERNDAVSDKAKVERERRAESDAGLNELQIQYAVFERKFKSIDKEIVKIDEWVNRTQSNEQLIGGLRKDVDKQQKEFEDNDKAAAVIIDRIQSLDTLKTMSPGNSMDGDLVGKISESIGSLNEINGEVDAKIEGLKKIDHEYGFELDKISEMIYNLKVLIDSTRDIANEIKVAVRFNESSVLRLKNSQDFAPSMTSAGSLYVKTQQAYAPIAFVYNEHRPATYMSLYLRDGQPHFSYKLSAGDNVPPTVLQTPYRINDGKWHKLAFERVGHFAKFKVHSEKDQVVEVQAESKDKAIVFDMDQTDTRFVLGQLPSDSIGADVRASLSSPDGQLHGQFYGGLDTVQFNGEPFGLWNYDSATNIAGELKRSWDARESSLHATIDSSAIRFNENSFMCLKIKKRYRLQSKKPLSVTVGFKTSAPNGLIWLAKEFCSKGAYCEPKKYISIYLKNGYLNVDVDNANAKFSLDTAGLTSNRRRLNDNRFHTVNVKIGLANRRDSVNDFLSIRVVEVVSGDDNEDQIDLGDVSHELVSGQRLAMLLTEQCLAGVPENYRDIASATKDIGTFVGCMNVLNIDQDPVSLQLERLKPTTLTARVGPQCTSHINQCSFKKSTEPTYVSFDMNVSSVDDKATFGISFVPLSLSGSLLFIRQRELQDNNKAVNYIYLYMDNGRVILVVRNTNEVSRLESNVHIAYSELHHVYVVKDGSEFTLTVNQDTVKATGLVQKTRIYTNSDLFVGGVPKAERAGVSEQFYNYHGCIVGLIYKNEQLRFDDLKSSSNDNLVFDSCYGIINDNRLYSQKDFMFKTPKAVIQHLSQQLKPKIKDDECTLSSNYDQTHMKTVGVRFGLTRDSRLEVWENHIAKSNTFVSFKFRTLLQDGLLFYASDALYKDFIAIWLDDGYMHFGFDCGSGIGHMKSTQMYNDGRYHTIVASRDGQNAMLIILDRTNTTVLESIEARAPGLDRSLSVVEPYYIGSLPADVVSQLPKMQVDLLATEPYIGCMSDFVIGNKPLKTRVQKINVMNCSNNHESGVFLTGKIESHAQLPSQVLVKDLVDIEFDMKPRTKNGIVLYIGSAFADQLKDYILLELVNGELHYRVSIGGMNNMIKYMPKYANNELCNANWIRIKIVKDNKGHIMLLVRNQELTPDFNPEMLSFAAKESTLYFGALPNAELRARLAINDEPFVGCIRDLVINQTGYAKPIKALLNLNLGKDALNYCPLK